MNTGKATWLKHPKHVITTLHSYSYEGKGDLCVMFTLGEEGTMSLYTKCEGERESELLLLHTPNDYLLLSSKGIRGTMFSLSFDIPMEIGNKIVLKKEKEELFFFDGDKCIFKLSNPAFLGSTSFGVISKGKGKNYIEVF